MLVALLLPWNSSSAQFVDPVTTDIVIGSCRSIGVENTGTSIFKDLQVVVVDGDAPSIIFYNHATGIEDCHPLQGFVNGMNISDPDVVWDYSSGSDIYVVYSVSNSGPMDGIWSERWIVDPTQTFIFGDINYSDPTNLIPITAQLEWSSHAKYANIDFSYVSPDAVVVWEDQGNIVALAGVQNPGFFPKYLVNSFCAGYTLPGTQPDIAIGVSKIVSIVYKQLNGLSNNIVVRQEDYNFIVLGNSSLLCVNETMVPTIVYDDVDYPRISMPKVDIQQPVTQNPFDCNVTYELITSTGSFIGSSTHKTYLYNVPSIIPGCPFSKTYTHSINWTHDLINTIGLSLSNMNSDLSSMPNSKPVTTYAGDLIYNAWTWNDQSGLRHSLNEVLAVGIQTYNSPNLISTIFNTFPCPPTENYTTEVSVMWADYLVVGEAFVPNELHEVVSTASDGGSNIAFAFIQTSTNDIIIKNSNMVGSPVIRNSGSNGGGPIFYIDNGFIHNDHEINYFPNPSSGRVQIVSKEKIANIKVFDILGKTINLSNSSTNQFNYELDFVENGVYVVQVEYVNGRYNRLKVIIDK